jgi:diguanylate cyclase (GGDEF)-like protein
LNALSAVPFDILHAANLDWLLGVVISVIGLFTIVVALSQCHYLRRRPRCRWLRRLGDLMLTREPRQRRYSLRLLIGALNCLTGLLALDAGVLNGVIEPEPARWLIVLGLVTLLLSYAVLRAGWNKKLRDPSMATPNLLVTILFLAWGYDIGGIGRPVALMLLLVALMFGIFLINARLVVRGSLFAVLCFGTVMAAVAHHEADVPNAAMMQWTYFGVMLISLTCLCALAFQFTSLRAKATQRKKELTAALGRIRELAIRDELTGLFNRRHMLELLNTEKHRSQRSGRPFCISLIDLDHFKSINDVHGHGVGDQVLGSAATTISQGLRESDVVARWGGEEFLVVFTDTDCATAEQVLTRIQNDFAGALVSTAVPDLKVNFSAGLACYHADELLTQTIDRADRALYMAKAAGRGRVVCQD